MAAVEAVRHALRLRRGGALLRALLEEQRRIAGECAAAGGGEQEGALPFEEDVAANARVLAQAEALLAQLGLGAGGDSGGGGAAVTKLA